MGTLRKTPLKNPGGFTMAEVLIVLSIIGTLAAISSPIFLQQKDRVILEVTKANLAAARSCLSQYAAGTISNKYPVGKMGYHDFRQAIPESRLPPIEAEAKFLGGSFLYSSDGSTYLIRAASTNRSFQRFAVFPSGIIRE